jgi:hypothetical protein
MGYPCGKQLVSWLEELLAYKTKEKRMQTELEKMYAEWQSETMPASEAWDDELSDADIIEDPDDEEETQPFIRIPKEADPILNAQTDEILERIVSEDGNQKHS